jgi:hypothetical protein
MGSCDIALEMHHPSRGGSIMTDRTATGWAQAGRYTRRYLEADVRRTPVRSCAVGGE